MNRVGKTYAAVVARAFEAAEIAAQNLHPPELSFLDCVAQPLRGRVESENVADLQYPFVVFCQFGQLLRLSGCEGDRLFDEHILARLEELATQCEVGGRRRDDDRSVNSPGKVMMVGRKMIGGDTKFACRFETVRLQVGHEQLNGQRIEHAQMICAPASETQ